MSCMIMAIIYLFTIGSFWATPQHVNDREVKQSIYTFCNKYKLGNYILGLKNPECLCLPSIPLKHLYWQYIFKYISCISHAQILHSNLKRRQDYGLILTELATTMFQDYVLRRYVICFMTTIRIQAMGTFHYKIKIFNHIYLGTSSLFYQVATLLFQAYRETHGPVWSHNTSLLSALPWLTLPSASQLCLLFSYEQIPLT